MATPNFPIPVCEMVFGHEQCPKDYHARDPELVRVTAGTLMGALVRLIAEYNPETGNFSRTRISCQINKFLELGWAHLSMSEQVARFLTTLATTLPEVAAYAWGDNGKQLAQGGYALAFTQQFLGKTVLPDGAEWFTAGWFQIAPRPDVQDLYTRFLWEGHGARVVSWMKANGYDSAQLLATGVRAANSGKFDDGKNPDRSLVHLVKEFGPDQGLKSFWSNVWQADNDLDRLKAVQTWPEFQGKVTSWPSPDDLNWGTDTIYPRFRARSRSRAVLRACQRSGV